MFECLQNGLIQLFNMVNVPVREALDNGCSNLC